jgi:hypothetical protein
MLRGYKGVAQDQSCWAGARRGLRYKHAGRRGRSDGDLNNVQRSEP